MPEQICCDRAGGWLQDSDANAVACFAGCACSSGMLSGQRTSDSTKLPKKEAAWTFLPTTDKKEAHQKAARFGVPVCYLLALIPST
jgi:hypothetical protein